MLKVLAGYRYGIFRRLTLKHQLLHAATPKS